MGAFAKSFSEAFNKTAPMAASGTLDAIKEKIKLDQTKAEEKYKATTMMHNNIAISAQLPDQEMAKKIASITEASGTSSYDVQKNINEMLMKQLAPKDELTQAIKEQTLEQKKLQNAEGSLPAGLSSLGKEATPEDKSAFLDKLDPVIAENVQGLADYSLDPTKVAGMRQNQRQVLLAATRMYDPTFDMKKYPAQQQYVKDLADTKRGTVGGIVNSANTLVNHIGFLDSKIDQLKNTNLKPQNAIINLAKDITGDPSIINFRQAKEVVDSELEVLLTGVGATQEGLNARRTLLSENAGYKQMKEALQTIGHIMQARTKPLEQQYEGLFGKPAGDTILHADAKQTLNKLFGTKSGTQGFDIGGQHYDIPLDKVDAFKKAKGL